MFRFAYLDKQQKDIWLPQMFDLLYDNMRLIAPMDRPYEEEKQQWLSNVSPALKKAPRYIQEWVGYTWFFGFVMVCCFVTVAVTFLVKVDPQYGRKTR